MQFIRIYNRLSMPNTKSAIRRTKKTKLQTSINKIRKSKYKSAIRQMNSYILSNKVSEAKKYLPEFYSQLMKIAKTGVIKKKTVSRKISRISKKLMVQPKKN
jgi:small subunit ribosomal protein S20